MTTLDDLPPAISPDVSVSPPDREGKCVAKNRANRTYVRLGAQERFLLLKLDGKSSYVHIARDFQTKFGEPVSVPEIAEFVKMAKKQKLIGTDLPTNRQPSLDDPKAPGNQGFFKRCAVAAREQKVLFFRVPLLNPDQSLNWLEPKTRWIFSIEMALASSVIGLWALLTTWIHGRELAEQVNSLFGLKAALLALGVAIVVSVFHEFGHGLACKRYGGEVHEMGALWIFFTPCLYCNVSDAWLLPSRWQRFMTSAAGTYVDFIIWGLSVIVWRITEVNTTANFMAWVIVTTCGLRVFFNINPLLRLDGYYAISDILGQHNLRRRSRERWMEYVRWMLWGGRRPQPTEDGNTLLVFGVISWFFTVGFLALLGFRLSDWLRSLMGIPGILAGVTFFALISKRYFRGSLGEDFMIMFQSRKKRIIAIAILGVGAMFVPVRDRVGGEFQVKPLVHWEVRAPIAGFLREIQVHEGDRVSSGYTIAKIEVPELVSNIAQKKLEIDEVEANVRRLQAGPRHEEVYEQTQRVERAVQWCKLAERDLAQAYKSFQAELATFEIRIAQAKADIEYRETLLSQAQELYDQGGLAGRQLLTIKKHLAEAHSALDETQAMKRARDADGVLQYEAELAKREKELADTKSNLALLEAGSRPEDIEAETARLIRLREALSHLESQHERQVITCPVQGTVITPRLDDKIGQYFERGAVICIVEDLEKLEAEIAVAEQDAQTLTRGQAVTLKPRSLPFVSLAGRVDRVSPAVTATDNLAKVPHNKTVVVYCHVENTEGSLRGGMTGFGRVHFGTRPLGAFLLRRGVRTLRSEFQL